MGCKGAFLLLFGALVLASPGAAQGGDPLSLSGIRYPEGFDLNTTGDVEGRAGHLSAGEDPVWFRLAAGRETYSVLTVPRWYWSRLGAQLPEGAEVVVRGSKTVGRDGNLYVVAQELRLPDGRVVAFRDRKGTPLWTSPSTEGPGASWRPDQQRGGMMTGPMRPGGMGGMGSGMGGGMHRSGR